MRLTSTCCVRSGAVCQEDAIVQGAELGQRQRTAAIRRPSERPAKSLRNWIRARREITPCCVYRRTAPLQVQLLTLLQRILVSFRHPQFYRHTPLAGSRRRLYGLQSSLHHQSIDSSSLVKQRRDCLRGRLASPRSRHNTFHIHSVSTPASSSWTSTSGQKRRMYVSSLPSRW